MLRPVFLDFAGNRRKTCAFREIFRHLWLCYSRHGLSKPFYTFIGSSPNALLHNIPVKNLENIFCSSKPLITLVLRDITGHWALDCSPAKPGHKKNLDFGVQIWFNDY
jgi:hypothetical protein